MKRKRGSMSPHVRAFVNARRDARFEKRKKTITAVAVGVGLAVTFGALAWLALQILI